VSKKVTQSQVARLANVSIPTVSRILNRTAHVSPEVKQRVCDAAARLGFPMAADSRRVIAFLLSNRAITHPFHSEVMAGAEAHCTEHDYQMLFCTLHYSLRTPLRQLPTPRMLNQRGTIDGYILAGVNSESLLSVLGETGLPLSVFGTTVVGDNFGSFPTVCVDESCGAEEMTRYLQQELGHTAIWFVGNVRRPWFRRRYEAYCRAMQEKGLTPLLSEFDSDDEQQVGYLATKSILDRGEKVTAIFAANDRTAHGVYGILRDRGIQIGEAISVAGFNDTLEAMILHPTLTTVRVHAEQVGRRLAEMVLRQIDGAKGTNAVTVPTRLIKRESCRKLIELKTK
jgi:LacI family transcriptional regulator